MDALSSAQFGYADFTPEPFEYDTYLFFSGKLTAGPAFNFADRLLGWGM